MVREPQSWYTPLGMGLKCIKDEQNMLKECDLYSKNRSKLNSCLNNIPFNYPDFNINHHSHDFNCNISNLKDQLKRTQHSTPHTAENR